MGVSATYRDPRPGGGERGRSAERGDLRSTPAALGLTGPDVRSITCELPGLRDRAPTATGRVSRT